MNFKIDWLEVTVFVADGENNIVTDLLSRHASDTDVPLKGRWGYEHRYELCDGTLLIYIPSSTEAPRMGYHIVFTGGYSSTTGEHLTFVLKHLYSYGTRFNITRIDLAADVFERDLSVEDVKSACVAAQAEGVLRKRKWSVVAGSDGGGTFYSGSRASEAMMRAYDKGIESATLPSGKWLRIEFEIKGKLATDVRAAFAGNPTERIFDKSAHLFYSLLVQHVPMTTIHKTGIDTWGLQPLRLDRAWSGGEPDYWIHNTVPAAVAKRIGERMSDDEKSEFIRDWLKSMRSRIGKQHWKLLVAEAQKIK